MNENKTEKKRRNKTHRLQAILHTIAYLFKMMLNHKLCVSKYQTSQW